MSDLLTRLRETVAGLRKDMDRKELRTKDVLLLSDMRDIFTECADEIETLRAQINDIATDWQVLHARLAAAPVGLMDTRIGLGVCALAEEDFEALYALKGKRVRLVVEE